MKTRVDIVPAALKHLHTLGPAVAIVLLQWMADVQDLGLTEAQKIAAYDDRAARGKPGVRSAKLTGTFRAYYRVVSGVVVIQDINQLESN